MKTTVVYVWLVSSLIHMISAGCVLSDSVPIHITGFTGDSVVLPCACTDVQKKPGQFSWTADPWGQDTVIFSQSPPNDRYKDRVQVLDSISPGNLSLRLSNLTLSDGGSYRCEADGSNSLFNLTVNVRCILSDSEPKHITRFTGDSVILPCACTDVQSKPKFVKWTAQPSGHETFVIVQQSPANVGPYKDRVRMLDSVSPGNLSIRVSDLTLSDGGTYMCEADGSNRLFNLTVNAGCVLSDSEHIRITGLTGDSVILPCSCTDVQRKPGRVKWTADPGGQSTVIFRQSYPSFDDRYKHRVQVLDYVSSGNLSLCLSNLTLSDAGRYRCTADGNYRDITLTVTGVTTQSPAITKHVSRHGNKPLSEDHKKKILYAIIAAVVAVVAVCGAVLIYCRVRFRKNAHAESREQQEMRTREQEKKNTDSVTYSTVVHSKTVKNTKIQNQSEDTTEYSSIKLV